MKKLLGILLLLAAACSDTSEPTAGGAYTASLLTSNAPSVDGAALIELRGGGIDTVTAVSGITHMHRVSAAVVRVVVVREEPGPIEFRLLMAERAQLPAAAVLEVADGSDQLRSTSAYVVRFAR